MNHSLRNGIREVEALPEKDQEEIALALHHMAVRKRIDARLDAALRRGGEMPAEVFYAELQEKYGE
ncbi:MAG: hypothetical protein M9939_04535 [Mesorhizobium sp.]|nr:hypothetical protein [Mesorhizobium sp.]MCO5160377.1 hypothetical protein [Mesorhizobium sp.]